MVESREVGRLLPDVVAGQHGDSVVLLCRDISWCLECLSDVDESAVDVLECVDPVPEGGDRQVVGKCEFPRTQPRFLELLDELKAFVIRIKFSHGFVPRTKVIKKRIIFSRENDLSG